MMDCDNVAEANDVHANDVKAKALLEEEQATTMTADKNNEEN